MKMENQENIENERIFFKKTAMARNFLTIAVSNIIQLC